MSLASSDCFSRAELRYDRVGGVVRGAILFLFFRFMLLVHRMMVLVGFWVSIGGDVKALFESAVNVI